MDDKTTAVRTALALVALVMSLAGCAEPVKRMSAAEMCAAANGTYSTDTQTCDTPAATARKASDMCQARGGFWETSAQVCEMGRH